MKSSSIGRHIWPVAYVTIAAATALGGAQAETPLLTGMVPDSGVTTPGAKVRIYGNNIARDTRVFFGGAEAREMNLLSSTTMEVVTPYLRPGRYHIQIKSGGATFTTQLTFGAAPSPMDEEFDRAARLAGQGRPTAALELLSVIANSASDYQVRAYAHYSSAQIYFSLGDWWRWAGQAGAIFLDSDKSGAAVQTNWRYRLAADESEYLLPTGTDPDHDQKAADWTVELDVTESPEPRFYRGLVSARYGNPERAKADVEFILAAEPENRSYRALAAYVAALRGNSGPLNTFPAESVEDARALALLGEAAFLTGDSSSARAWWGHAARIYPKGASLACLAGKRHMARGQQRVAESLLTECAVMAPNSKEGQEAKQLLAALSAPHP